MTLGYISIGLTVLIVLALTISRTSKTWLYYLGIYLIGGCLILSTTLASSQLIGTDVNVEYYFSRMVILNGWDTSLNNSFNSSMPITVLAPLLSGYSESNLIWVYKIVFPLLFACAPVLLLYIYSRFMPIKTAFLSSFIFIIVPTYLLEMPQIARQMVSELVLVGIVALLISKIDHKWKMLYVLICSLIIIASHYSMATFLFVILFVATIGYLRYDKEKWRALDLAIILILSIGCFYGYSHWVASGWQVEDMANATKILTDSIVSGGIASGNVQSNPISINWLHVVLVLGLAYGVYQMIVDKKNPGIYKLWIIMAFSMLLVSIIYPSISSSINFTRYYHLMLIFLAPAVVYTFKRATIRTTTTLAIIVFIISSGLLFNLMRIDNIEYPNIPYSIALENKRLDAGNYLTDTDDDAARWAYENGIEEIYCDLGGNAALEHYYPMRELKMMGDFSPGTYIFFREWNNNTLTYAITNGVGLRKQIPFPDSLECDIIFQTGNSLIARVK